MMAYYKSPIGSEQTGEQWRYTVASYSASSQIVCCSCGVYGMCSHAVPGLRFSMGVSQAPTVRNWQVRAKIGMHECLIPITHGLGYSIVRLCTCVCMVWKLCTVHITAQCET